MYPVSEDFESLVTLVDRGIVKHKHRLLKTVDGSQQISSNNNKKSKQFPGTGSVDRHIAVDVVIVNCCYDCDISCLNALFYAGYLPSRHPGI
jgi:hypothetical protein